MKNLFGFTKEMLEEYFIDMGEKKYKATQVFEWLYRHNEYDISKFSNIKKEILIKMQNDFTTEFINIEKVLEGSDVKKFLFRLLDGEKIEAVLMEHNYGLSVCVSSQVGCNMGCAFCESGRLKKVRNLETAEMVEQVLQIEKDFKKRISHVVLMGIGEPFDNYDNVIRFIRILNHPKGFAIGARHITVSTCGIVPKIYEFSHLKYQVNLAISLHAPNNELRDKLMPINKVYPLEELIKAVKYYIEKTNRRVTFEYILLSEINDGEKEARELVKLIKGLNAYINLIPYNQGNSNNFKRTKNENIMKFYDIIKKEKINVTVRREFGSNISAACGQLRSKKEE